MQEYNRRINLAESNEYIMAMSDYLSVRDKARIEEYNRKWNFYEGFHWEDIDLIDKPQITKNYCRPFVDKFVAFEFSRGFTISVPYEEDNDPTTPQDVTDFLNDIWDNHNDRLQFVIEMGQTKSVVGEAWVQVKYESAGEIDDPFGEYPQGRIRVINMSPKHIFPEYDPHDMKKLTKLTVMYPIKVADTTPILKKPITKTKIFKTIWTDKEVVIEETGEEPKTIPNPYKVIPFVHIKNYPLAHSNKGLSDLEDIIPLNVELNLKNSDISEIIDYHSAPVTVVYGANISSLEKGANKMWGGLPKDAKIENLTMNTDLGASIRYAESTKQAIHEIGSIPQNALGDIQSISNTSGIALQIMYMPLIERTRIKRLGSNEGIQKINKLILLMGLQNGMVFRPVDVTPREFYKTNTIFQDALPKDQLIELQQLETEMRIGVESRQGAMLRLGKDVRKVDEYIARDFKEHSEFYGHQKKSFNSGILNGETKSEVVNKELRGENISENTEE